jgi:hypothetical protein
MTQKYKTQVFKFLTSLTPLVPVAVYKPRNINVVFSLCGSLTAWQCISPEVTVKGPMQWKGLKKVCCGMRVRRMGR